MANTSTAPVSSAASKGLIARFIGVITSPRDTFQSVAAHPKWFGMLVLTTVIVATCSVIPMTTEAGRQAALDKQVSQMEAFGQKVNDAQYARMEKTMAFAPYFTAAGILIGTPIFTVIIAGILFAVFNAALGGEATFKQLFSVWVHSGVISALGQMFTLPLNLLRGSVGSATNLAVLLPMVDDTSFIGRILSMIDLFIVWGVMVGAIGLAVLYKRRTQPIAITFFAIYAVIVLCVAAIMRSLGGA
jgi:membrane protein, antimicrobial resistance system